MSLLMTLYAPPRGHWACSQPMQGAPAAGCLVWAEGAAEEEAARTHVPADDPVHPSKEALGVLSLRVSAHARSPCGWVSGLGLQARPCPPPPHPLGQWWLHRTTVRGEWCKGLQYVGSGAKGCMKGLDPAQTQRACKHELPAPSCLLIRSSVRPRRQEVCRSCRACARACLRPSPRPRPQNTLS